MENREALKSALAATPNCLSLEQLEALTASGNKSNPHVEQCARCQAELEMLKAFESNEPLPGEGAAVTWISSQMDRRLEQIKHPARASAAAGIGKVSWLSRVFGRSEARLWVPAGVLAVLVTAGALWMRSPKEPALQANLQTDHPIYRSQEVELVSPEGAQPEAPSKMEWKAFDRASNYKVSIMEIDRNPLWGAETQGISADVPAATRGKMLPGKTLLWQVTAFDSEGRILATSQIHKFLVSPRGSGSSAN